MGSLMGGWDSPTSNSGKGRFERNKSLTNEEIETFWKIKRQSEEEHLQPVAEGQAQEFSTHNNINVSEATLTRGATDLKLAAKRPTGLDTSRSFPGYHTTTVAADSQITKDDLDMLKNAKAWCAGVRAWREVSRTKRKWSIMMLGKGLHRGLDQATCLQMLHSSMGLRPRTYT